MTRILLALSTMTVALFSFSSNAATATCKGQVKGMKLDFFAKGSLLRTRDGSGHVKINNRLVAQFDGDAAKINYFRKTFSIQNDRGDVVEGKLNNVNTGASTLTKLYLPGEGIRVTNAPVKCSVN